MCARHPLRVDADRERRARVYSGLMDPFCRALIARYDSRPGVRCALPVALPEHKNAGTMVYRPRPDDGIF